MRLTGVMTLLILAAVSAAPAQQAPRRPVPPPAAQQRCPMCGQMMRAGQGMPGMQGGMMGGGMMNPQMMARMQPMMMPATVTVAADGSIYVLRGGSLYKYSKELKLLASAQLPAPGPAMGGAAPGAAGEHEQHH